MKKNKIVAVFLSLCLVFSGVVYNGQNVVKAASETTTWNLYYNPYRPSQESVTTWRQNLYYSSWATKFTVTSISRDVTVSCKIENFGTEYLSLAKKTRTIYNDPGYVGYSIVKYKNNVNKINRVAGTVVH